MMDVLQSILSPIRTATPVLDGVTCRAQDSSLVETTLISGVAKASIVELTPAVSFSLFAHFVLTFTIFNVLRVDVSISQIVQGEILGVLVQPCSFAQALSTDYQNHFRYSSLKIMSDYKLKSDYNEHLKYNIT